MVFVRGGDKKVRAELAFCSQRTGVDRRAGMKPNDVVGELAIQKAGTILSSNSEFCSVTEVKEHGGER
jgi:hypothetical protein